MSNEPDKQHPWAKFKAAPQAPHVPLAPAPATPRPSTAASAPKPLARAPIVPPPPAAAPAAPSTPAPPTPVPAAIAFPKRVVAPVALPARPAKPAEVEDEAPRKDWAAPRLPGTADKPGRDPQERTIPPFGIDQATADAFVQAAEEDAAFLRKKRADEPGFSLWRAIQESFAVSGERSRSLAEWWRDWRKTATFKVLAAFLVFYAVLAVVRRPNATAIEQSRHAEELGALQTFFKNYAAAGGVVLAEKPHGGTELYPRGILLQAEMLDAFRRAPLGEAFSVAVTDPMWNPLASFYGYPPIFVGGTYFHLERKFNLRLYRFTFLIRKDSEKSGTILLTKVELGF